MIVPDVTVENYDQWAKALQEVQSKSRSRSSRDTNEDEKDMEWLLKQNYTLMEPIPRLETGNLAEKNISNTTDFTPIILVIMSILFILTWGIMWKLFRAIKAVKGDFLI